MIEINEVLKENLLSEHQKYIEIVMEDGTVLSSDSIKYESLRLEQTLCDADEVTYGLCNSASFEITVYATAYAYQGKWLTPKFVYEGHEDLRLLMRCCLITVRRSLLNATM